MQSHDEYEFSFPPGSMGLELEPVIKSSERELGCRVKDFYFGEDYDGIPQEKLQDMVHVGDIICSVNGIGVKSLPFVEVVDQLRNLKNQSRIIRFKNIAASWSRSATLTLTPGDVATSKIHSPKKQAVFKNPEYKDKRLSSSQRNENVANQQQEQLTSPKRSSSASLTTTPRKFGTERRSNNKPQGLSQVAVEDDCSEEMAMQSPITPSAIRKSGKKKSIKEQPIPFMLPLATIQQPSVVNVGQQLSEAGLKLGEKAVEATLSASSLLVMNAHEAINTAAKALPRYSLLEMQSMEHKKNQLLHELSKSVYELRTAENLQQLTQKQAEEIDSLLLRQAALETELQVLHSETREDREQLVNARKQEQAWQRQCTLMQQDLHEARQQHQQEHSIWQSQALEFQSTIERLQQEKYTLEVEHDTKLDMFAEEVKQLKYEKESQNRGIEAMNLSTESLRKSLLEKDEEADVLTQRLHECQHRCTLSETAMHALEKDLQDTGKALSESQHALLLSSLTQDSQAAQLKEKCFEVESLHSQLQNSTIAMETQSAALANYKLEGNLLEDKVRILELTVAAQQNELICNQSELASSAVLIADSTAQVADTTAQEAKLKEVVSLHLLDMQKQVIQLRLQHDQMIPDCYAQFDSLASFLQESILPMATTSVEAAIASEAKAANLHTMVNQLQDELKSSDDKAAVLAEEVCTLQVTLQDTIQAKDQARQQAVEQAIEQTQEQAKLEYAALEALKLQQAEETHQAELEQTCNIFTRQVKLLEESMQALRNDSEHKGVVFLQSIESIESQRSKELLVLQQEKQELEKQFVELRTLHAQVISEKEYWEGHADSACEDLLQTRASLKESEARSVQYLQQVGKLEQLLQDEQTAKAVADKQYVARMAALEQELSLSKAAMMQQQAEYMLAEKAAEKTTDNRIRSLQSVLVRMQMTVHANMVAMRKAMKELQEDCDAKDDLHNTICKSYAAQITDLQIRSKQLSQSDRVAELSIQLRQVEKTARENEQVLLQRIFTAERGLVNTQGLQQRVKEVEESLFQVSADLQRSRNQEQALVHQVQALETTLISQERVQDAVKGDQSAVQADLQRLQGDYALVCQQLSAMKQQRQQDVQEQDELIDQLQAKEGVISHMQAVLVDIYRSLHGGSDSNVIPEDLSVKLPQLLQDHLSHLTDENILALQTQRQQAEKEMQVLTSTHATQLNAARVEAQEALDETVIRNEIEVVELRQEIVSLTQTNTQLSHQLLEVTVQIGEKSKALQDAQVALEERTKLQIEATNSSQVEERHTATIAALQTQITELQQQLTAANEEFSRVLLAQEQSYEQAVCQARLEKRNAIAEHNSTIELLRREHETALSTLKQQEADIITKQEEAVAVLRQEIVSLTQTNTQLSHHLLEITVQAGELEQALRDSHRAIEDLHRQQVTHEHAVKNNISAQQIELKVMQTRLNEAEQRVTTLSADLQASERQVLALENVLATQESKQALLMQHQEQAAREAVQVKDLMITSLEQTVNEIKEQLLFLTDRNQSLVNDYRERCLEIHASKESQAEHAHDQIQSLRDAMSTMEQALALADDREQEIRVVLAQQRAQHGDQIAHYRTAAEHAQRTAQLAAQGLQRKQRELDSLLLHVQELLKTTQSPLKTPPPPPPAAAVVDASSHDKENTLQPRTLQSQLHQAAREREAGGEASDFFVIGEENEWHDTILLQSLSLHEMLSFTGLTLLQCKDSGNKLQELFKRITEAHYKLHHLLVRPPWISPLSAIPSLSPAFSSSSSAVQETPATTAAVVEEDGDGSGYEEYEEQFHVLMGRLKTLEASAASALPATTTTINDSQTARMLQLEAQDTVVIDAQDEQHHQAMLGSPISAERVSFYISPLRSGERDHQVSSSGHSRSKRQMPKALVFTSPMTTMMMAGMDDSLLVSDDGLSAKDDDEDGEDELRRLLMNNESNQGLSFEESSLLDFELLKAEL